MTELCTRSDHSERPHWHYGPAGRYWCTDRYSALLNDSNGRIYVKPEATE